MDRWELPQLTSLLSPEIEDCRYGMPSDFRHGSTRDWFWDLTQIYDDIVRVCQTYLASGKATGQPFVDAVNELTGGATPMYFDELVHVLMLCSETVDLLTQLAPLGAIIDAVERLNDRSLLPVRPRGAIRPVTRRTVNPRRVFMLAARDAGVRQKLWTIYDRSLARTFAKVQCTYPYPPGASFIYKVISSYSIAVNPPVSTCEASAAFQTIDEYFNPPPYVYDSIADCAASCVVELVVDRSYTDLAELILDTFIARAPRTRARLSREIAKRGKERARSGCPAWAVDAYASDVNPLITRAEPTTELLEVLLGPHAQEVEATDEAALQEIAKRGDPYAKNVAAWLSARDAYWTCVPTAKTEYAD